MCYVLIKHNTIASLGFFLFLAVGKDLSGDAGPSGIPCIVWCPFLTAVIPFITVQTRPSRHPALLLLAASPCAREVCHV